MNLSDILFPTPAGAGVIPAVVSSQGESPQESALATGFAGLFALSLTAPAAEGADNIPDEHGTAGGKKLPEEGGTDLPWLAGALAMFFPAPGSDDAPPEGRAQSGGGHSPAALFEHASRPGAPQLPRGPGEGEARFFGSSTPAVLPHAIQTQPGDQAGKLAGTMHLSLPLRPIGHDGPDLLARNTRGETQAPSAAPAIAPEQAARLAPVGQLLRPAAPASSADQPEISATQAATETPSQRSAPSTQPIHLPQPAAPAAQLGEAPRLSGPQNAGEALLSSSPTMSRHDFGQVIERLAEAREMARPARGEVQVMHREFGQVSMQFDIAGGTLKVALANSHSGFASAVQAALADRPIVAPTDAGRTDVSHQQSGQQHAQSAAQQGHPSSAAGQGQMQGDSHHHRHGESQRQGGVQPQPRGTAENPDGKAVPDNRRGRDSALFA